MEIPGGAKVVIKVNGPYLVSGALPLGFETIEADGNGTSVAWKAGRSLDPGEETYALCRCGASGEKPYCDGTHVKIGFDGTETASRGPQAAGPRSVTGPALELADDEPLCAWARFCDAGGGIWDLTKTAAAGSDAAALAAAGEERCPSGRLVLRPAEGGAALEPALPASVSLVEDGPKDCSGPIWLKGGVPVFSRSGEGYAVRNRVTLCRCGASKNKPFCDGSHVDVAFRDGLDAGI